MRLEGAGAGSSLLAAASTANRERPAQIAAAVEASLGGLAGRRVLVLGITYKPGVPDLRGAAPVVMLAALAARGAVACWHDPLIEDAPASLVPATRVEDPASARADAVILGTPHRDYDPDWIASLAPVVFDPFGLLPREAGDRVRVV